MECFSKISGQYATCRPFLGRVVLPKTPYLTYVYKLISNYLKDTSLHFAAHATTLALVESRKYSPASLLETHRNYNGVPSQAYPRGSPFCIPALFVYSLG
jgi:hypothetical protein